MIKREKALTLAIVIPVYNEERYLKACLDSIKRQSVMPDEVIVVDNNSTDQSIKIANSYRFVKVIHEKRQHQSFAQATGFNAATSNILGRIDGDSILPADWVQKVKQSFESKEVVAITGGAAPYDAPMQRAGMAVFDFYFYVSGLIAGHRMIWGANCAIRRNAWRKIKTKVLKRGDIWEDYDLAFCVSKHGRINYVRKMRVGMSARAVHSGFIKQIRYQFRAVRTYYLRAGYLKTFFFSVTWLTLLIFFPLAMLDRWLQKDAKKYGKPRA